MKKSIYFLFAIAIFLLLTPNVFSNMTGSPGGKTDSPSDGANCTQCHTGTINSGTGTLTVMTNIPTQGYTAGQQYAITIQLMESNCNRFGFEITCEENNFGSQKTGSFVLTDATNTQFANNSTSITHTLSGISGTNMKIWTMDWIAPSNISSGVEFYVSAVAANNNGNTNGDQVYTTTHSFGEATSTVSEKQNNITAFVNPISKDIMINVVEPIHISNLEVYDISAKLVYSKKEVLLPSTININFLNTGIYILNMKTRDGEVISKKVILS
ncbi:MAG TPA: choice-of-anchor V domain-containing protein [Flavobacteriales bacterium]|jgi:hypothetical protein|nr:T9SS type A sorting domain-containing protein [Flavobacteriales bacterium]HJN63411.1 choice-of-anchor V domain-containing protein [Flavobacteriales bacterium]|tara:strand:- start:9654 stop:10463 length:810 start_codon:yes stop_codon:yes gene_type:complete